MTHEFQDYKRKAAFCKMTHLWLSVELAIPAASRMLSPPHLNHFWQAQEIKNVVRASIAC